MAPRLSMATSRLRRGWTLLADAVACAVHVPLPLVPREVVEPALVDGEQPGVGLQQLEGLPGVEVPEHEAVL